MEDGEYEEEKPCWKVDFFVVDGCSLNQTHEANLEAWYQMMSAALFLIYVLQRSVLIFEVHHQSVAVEDFDGIVALPDDAIHDRAVVL